MRRLLQMGLDEFGRLSKSEELLLNSVAAGNIAWCGVGDALSDFWNLGNDPDNPTWHDVDRKLRAMVLEWLCSDSEARKFIHPNGVQLGAAQIQGRLNLSDSSLSFKLRLTRCYVPEGIDAYFSQTQTLNFLGSHLGPVSARRLSVNGDLLFGGGSVVNGEINLRDAEVARDFDCAGGHFYNAGGVAIKATGLRVGRHARLGFSHRRDGSVDRFKCIGQIDLAGSKIGGDLDLSGASLSHLNGSAILLTGSRIDGSADLSAGFRSKGTADLSGSEIQGRLDCSSASFEAPMALLGCEIKVHRSILMSEGFTAKGEVNLGGAEIGGQVDARSGWFSNPGKRALSLNGAHVEDSVIFGRNFVADGRLDLVGSDIGGQVDCGGAYLANPEGITLDLNGASIRQDVFLCSDSIPTSGEILPWGSTFRSFGQIDLNAVRITGELNFAGASLKNTKGPAFTAISAKVGRQLSLVKNFSAIGEVNLTQCEASDLTCSECRLTAANGKCVTGVRLSISGNVTFKSASVIGVLNLQRAKVMGDATFEDIRLMAAKHPVPASIPNDSDFEFLSSKTGLNGVGMTVGGKLSWKNIQVGASTILYLQNAAIGLLSDQRASWPQEGNLRIDGCVYHGFEEDLLDAPVGIRLDWLRRQPFSYQPQTYKQLADVFRRDGREGDSIAVLVERENAHRRSLGKSIARRVRNGESEERRSGQATAGNSLRSGDRPRAWRLAWDVSRWAVMWPLKLLIGNGYRPLQAFWAGLVLVVLGAMLFSYGYKKNLIVPSTKESYDYYFSCADGPEPPSFREFNSFVYSLENFLPLIDLGERTSWYVRSSGTNEENHCLWPKPPRQSGWLVSYLRSLLWIHSILGWFVAGMFVAGITGLVRKD
jgi:hypothetical protein